MTASYIIIESLAFKNVDFMVGFLIIKSLAFKIRRTIKEADFRPPLPLNNF